MIHVEKLTMAERITCIKALGGAVEELEDTEKVFTDLMLFWPPNQKDVEWRTYLEAQLRLLLRGVDQFLLTWSLTIGKENGFTDMLLDSTARGCRANMLWDMIEKCQKELASKGKSMEEVQALMKEIRQMDDVAAMTRCEELMNWPDEVQLGKDE